MEINNLYTSFSPLHQIQKENGQQFASSIAKSTTGSRLIDLKEDPSAKAILGGIKADSAALSQASRNASVGMAFLNTVAGGLDQASTSLVRMKELAVSVVNGSLSEQERKMANEEYQVMMTQLDNIAERTRFNGNPLLGGQEKSNFMPVPNFSQVSGDDFLNDPQRDMLDYYDISNGVPEAGDYTITQLNGKYELYNFKNELIDVKTPQTGGANDPRPYVIFSNGIIIVPSSPLSADGSGTFHISYDDIYAVKTNYIELTESVGGVVAVESADEEEELQRLTETGLGTNSAFLDLSGILRQEADDHLPYLIPQGTYSVRFTTTDVDEPPQALHETPDFIRATYPDKIKKFGDTLANVGDFSINTSKFKSNHFSYQFQIGENLNDYRDIVLTDVSSVALGLKRTEITTSELGQAVQTQIERALDMINTIQASIGTQQAAMSNIISRIDTVKMSYDATETAVGGADIPEEIARLAESEALSQASIMGEAKLNERLSQTWRMLVT